MILRICSDLSEVKEIPKQNLQTTTENISEQACTDTDTDTHIQVKHCWRLMEAVIGVEVCIDTPDP